MLKAIISQDGTIGNSGDIQPDTVSFADLTVVDPGIASIPLPVTGAGIHTPVVESTVPSAFTVTSSAGIAADPAINSGQVSTLATANGVVFAPLEIVAEFAPSITNQVSSISDPTTAPQIENAISSAIDYYDTNWTSSVPIGTNVNGTIVNVVTVATGTSGTISNLDTMVLSHIGFQMACYLEGTRILTTLGEKRIEALSVGDQLPTLLGGVKPVIWLGRRAMDVTEHPRPWLIWPVRVRAGAFGPGLPSRDLCLSPAPAVYTGEVLIPIRLLINGSSIQQVKMDHVVYHHVELDHHDVIRAEGLPCESYLDAGDRDTFSGGPVTTLHPAFSAQRWEMGGCAPLVLTGAVLDAERSRLTERAGRMDDRTRPRVAAAS